MTDMTRSEKIRLAGIKKHGSEEAWREFLRQCSAKSERNTKGTGYFAVLKKTDPAKLKKISSIGGSNGAISKRLET